jgi:IrrE N-terminal-like domain/Macro domain
MMEMNEERWTHPSVRCLIAKSRAADPLLEIARRARQLALEGMEDGWCGPPFDPFELAERRGIALDAREDVPDARLVLLADGQFRIEFNPMRDQARIRFSIAHELGHLLFVDADKRMRSCDGGTEFPERADDWQHDVLCNVAAAELQMPAGAFPEAEADDLSLPRLMDLRARFGVSTEALLRRAVKLTDQPAALFAGARLGDPEAGFRVDYVVGSRAWCPHLSAGALLPATSVLTRCSVVGHAADAHERWGDEDATMRVQAVGVPPYPGHRFPRVVGLLTPDAKHDRGRMLRYLFGDASDPDVEGPAIIAHITNDAAGRWDGRGFAQSLTRRHPAAAEDYANWAFAQGTPRLGAVHLTPGTPGVKVASLVAQAGSDDSRTRRHGLRWRALRDALETLAALAHENRASVHMPLIGTGQDGRPWATVRDLVTEELLTRDVAVTVYVSPQSTITREEPAQMALGL